MNYFKPNKTIFDDFFEHRDMLIIQHMNGDINKKEYLELNYKYMLDKNVKPFQRIDSFEKGMYNYQYYNMMAKYHRTLAQEIKDKGKHISYYSKYLNEADYYYNENDKTVINEIKKVSKPGRRVYKGKEDIKRFKNGYGTIIVSTSRGVLPNDKAYELGIGGEVLCTIW